ncbi:Cryptochrome-2 [Rhynchospora pubera]|uniref:Cryptochrome-2 n=1 Tax=Rhynchospora pubera TaxID=906938 RepID=A0AAV8E632_9POAL|nr:Cryptochrome-2 [Rhynchospora pubera]KAJ4784346.1 Cryptochrome-2 [Rhynchospora pubera]
MSSEVRTIVWFRRDLRIEDNPALASAAKDGCLIPVFIWCPNEEGQFYPGRASRWWLKQSLSDLDQALRSLGTPLVVIKAESTIAALLQCAGAIGANRVVYNHLYDPVSLVRDHKIKSELQAVGLSVQSFNADLLYEPWEVSDQNGIAFTTFNEFWSKCLDVPVDIILPLPPWRLVPASGIENIQSCSVEELGLENNSEKSSNALLSRVWIPGCRNSDKLLTEFIDGHLTEYSKSRMKVDGNTTSLLSPYLHFGELSVRKIYRAVRMKQIEWAQYDEKDADFEESITLFLRSLGLREYSRYLCFNFPFTHERSLLGNLRHYPWRNDQGEFKAWRQGKTGYPLVDAGMRELWATGWIHNRTRVVVASFFVKVLLLPWTWGMKYFWDTLLDADLESDILGWQYISGSLPDGHELTRLDSPEVQGQRFDPEGEYVRNWVPELARMPTEWIHHPWDAPRSVLSAAGVELGFNYPKPIIDLDTARDRLDDAVSTMWQLDRASKLAAASPDEVVADNSTYFKNNDDNNILDIPKVVVKKEVSSVSSSLDQKVPSFNNKFRENLKANRNNSGNGNVRNRTERNIPVNQIEGPLQEEDVVSTAESSAGRKRSISESSYAVPSANFSLSERDQMEEWVPFDASMKSFKEEEDAQCESSINGERPSKRSG